MKLSMIAHARLQPTGADEQCTNFLSSCLVDAD